MDALKACFGDDDDEGDDIFPLTNTTQSSSNINNNEKNKYHNKKNKRKKRKNNSTNNKKTEKIILRDNFVVPPERRISIDVSKYKLEKKKYEKEDDNGNIEYKLKLCDVSKLRFQELKSGMNFRLHEGYGECYYEIGVEDNGNDLGITREELDQTVSLLTFIANDLSKE